MCVTATKKTLYHNPTLLEGVAENGVNKQKNFYNRIQYMLLAFTFDLIYLFHDKKLGFTK